MCFSLQASIIAAATLTAIGMITTAKNIKNRTRMIAMTPFLFGIQQACEAVIWLYKPTKKAAETLTQAMYGFLFFAYIFWPVWVPLALMHAEQDTKRKKILIAFLIIGVITGSMLGYMLATQPSKVCIECMHIVYRTEIPDRLFWPLTTTYTVATIIPWFVSSIRRMWFIGILLTISYAVAAWYYYVAFTSVWCFFAAAISATALMILDNNNALHKEHT